MNKRLVHSAVLLLGIALLPSGAIGQQKSIKEQLVGAWNPVAWERTAPDGTKVHAFGTNPKGVAYFGADGRFFVIFARADLPKLAANDRAKATPEEAKAIVGGVLAYAGTYRVDEPNKSISLRLEVTSFPNQATETKRTITSLSADELKYTNPESTAGGRVDVTLKRAAAATN
ncbi:MAG: lipocalin-like domain-containing protein [Xanthobacteraceae bacterium]